MPEVRPHPNHPLPRPPGKIPVHKDATGTRLVYPASESLDINGPSTASGGAVDQWNCWGAGNEQFVIAKNSAGNYTIASINSLDPVAVPGSSTKASGNKARSPRKFFTYIYLERFARASSQLPQADARGGVA
ncbi:MAG TPA: RICIN domain-containing protein [Streptosporangiaceae bacterium]|nr:RICIN domain-containing protein [Streptosporangiaceae bacterium]